MASIEKIRRKYREAAESYMEKAEKFAGKDDHSKDDHSYAARTYDTAAFNFMSANEPASYDKALRLASEQYATLAEQYKKEGFKPNLIGLAYKSAYQDIEKLTNKADSDKDNMEKLRALSEEYLKSAVSEGPDLHAREQSVIPGKSDNITTYNALEQVTKDESIKDSMDKKVVEETLAGVESNANKHGILSDTPLPGFTPTTEMLRRAIDKGIVQDSAFIDIYNNMKKKIMQEEGLKAYASAAHGSLSLAAEASEKGYPDIANEMASKALDLYKKAEDKVKKHEIREFCSIKEGEAKVYLLIGKSVEAQKAIQDAVDLYMDEAQHHMGKKRWLDAQLDLEAAQVLASRYGMHELTDGLGLRIAELKGKHP